jgi:pimeloyl-ACP methyl ester carboxylesterase
MSAEDFPTTDEQIKRANATGRTPVVFIHGLWLLPSSWDRWAAVFDGAGYAPLTPGWPDDPNTVEEARAHPEVFAYKTVGQVADHFCEVVQQLDNKPAVIGHSFGGLLAQIAAGRGLSAPLFQAATANLNPWTEVKVDTESPDRGPLLIISGEKDHTVPWAVANASYKQQKDNPGVTEIVQMPNRGHALTTDSGWREVCDKALAFVQRFVR